MITVAALQAEYSDVLDRAAQCMRQGDLVAAEAELRRAMWLRRLLDEREGAVLAGLEASLAE